MVRPRKWGPPGRPPAAAGAAERRPNVVKRLPRHDARLSDEHFLRTAAVRQDIEASDSISLNPRVKIGLGVFREPIGEDAHRMPRAHLSKNGIPSFRKGGVLGGLVSGCTQLLAQLFRRVVREPEDGPEEVLVRDRRAEKTGHLKA